MFELTATEAIGYVASLLIVVSLAMSSAVRLRVVNLAGSSTFLVYGILIASVPIILTNAAIAAINVWHLRKELGLRHELGVSPVPVDSPFLADFLAFHREDIHRFQPDAVIPPAAPTDDTMALLLTRDGLPAGVVIGRRAGEVLEVDVDYVLRPYRDSRLGAWLFGDASGVFRAAGIQCLVTQPGTDAHRTYLERVGFDRDADRYVLDLRSRPVR